jgi:threonine dehydrogenase-like Zn-dependent dehydrogenase
MGATDTICGSTTEVLAAVEAITEGKLVDLAVEAIGKVETLNLAAKLVRRNGTVLAFGLPHTYNYDFAFHEFFWNEGRLICSLGPTLDDFRAAVDMISNGVIAVAPLVTHSFFHLVARRKHSQSSLIAAME